MAGGFVLEAWAGAVVSQGQELLTEGLKQIAGWAVTAARCRSECAELAALLNGAQLCTLAGHLDSLTQLETFESNRSHYEDFTKQLQEAAYLVLQCQQVGSFNLFLRARVGRRIEGALSRLARMASDTSLAVNISNALQTGRNLVVQAERDAQAARDRAGAVGASWPPLQRAVGAVWFVPLGRQPSLVHVFQHLDDVVPELCSALPHHLVHGIVGMPGLGKTTIAAAVYDRTKAQYDSPFFVTVGKQADVLGLLRGVFVQVCIGQRVRTQLWRFVDASKVGLVHAFASCCCAGPHAALV